MGYIIKVNYVNGEDRRESYHSYSDSFAGAIRKMENQLDAIEHKYIGIARIFDLSLPLFADCVYAISFLPDRLKTY